MLCSKLIPKARPHKTTWKASLIIACLAVFPAQSALSREMAAPFFYDLLPENDRLDIVMIDAENLRIFEQSRRVGERKSFPFVSSALIQPQITEPYQQSEDVTNQPAVVLTESESAMFDSHLTIMDAGGELSVDQLVSPLLKAIMDHGARMQTSCSGDGCGAPEIWAGRFGLYGSGDVDSQRYYRAALPAGLNGADGIFAQVYEFYISKIGCCARIALIQSQPSTLQYEVDSAGTLAAAHSASVQSIYFGSGSSRLSQHNQLALSAFVESGQRCKAGSRIAIEGRTDSTGSRELNRSLSVERTISVSAYLLKQGLPADCMIELALGESSPDAAALSEQRSVRLRWLPAGWKPAFSEPGGVARLTSPDLSES